MCAAKKDKLGEYPKYGVTWFFRVAIEGGGTKDLGRWSSCGGLDVSFSFDEIKQMGVYDRFEYLPKENLQWGKITLERAMNKKTSPIVKKWIEEVTSKWYNDDGKPCTGSNITITMFDNVDQKVMSWTFRNAIPVKWTGPQFVADGNKVATEKLELIHQGFLSAPAKPGAATGSATPASGGPLKASLTYNKDTIKFQYNPTHFKMTQNAATDIGKPQSIEEHVKASGSRTFTIGPIQISGPDVMKTANKLFFWLRPQVVEGMGEKKADANAGTAGKGKIGKVKRKQAKLLELSLGDLGKFAVVLSKVDVDYTRFTPTGKPVRATLDLGFGEAPPALRNTNPTSGGPGGGKVRTVTEGDCLAAIANDMYGSPSAWRTIANANDIDDPLRVRPGASIFLPGA